GIRDCHVTGVQTYALPIFSRPVKVTIIGPAKTERAQFEAIGEQVGFDIQFCSNHADFYALLGNDEYRIGLSQQAPVSEKDLLRRSEERRVGKECVVGWWTV